MRLGARVRPVLEAQDGCLDMRAERAVHRPRGEAVPGEQELEPVRDFVRTNGLRITGIHSNRTLINFSGSVRDVERVFHVQFNSYRHPKENLT